MEKNDLIKILVLVAIAAFAGQMIAPGLLGTGTQEPENQQEVKTVFGWSTFNATVERYEPYVVLMESFDEKTENRIKEHQNVDDIITREGRIYVSLRTEEDVPEAMEFLDTLNLTPYAVVWVSLPPTIDVVLQNGSTERINTNMISMRSQIILYLDLGSKITTRSSVYGEENQLMSIGESSFVYDDETLEGEITILGLESKRYVYLIPWENRTIDPAEFEQYGTVMYDRADHVVFEKSLTTSEIMEKNYLEYVVYLSEASVTVDENFADVEIIKNDFGENVVFPDSTLIVVTEDDLNLSYEGEVEYTYTVDINVEGYGSAGNMTALLNKEYQKGETVSAEILASVLGNNIVEVLSIES